MASNALLMSTEIAAVRRGGLFWLNPEAIFCATGMRAVVVEWFLVKPCWVGAVVREETKWGSRRRSRILEEGQRRLMGR